MALGMPQKLVIMPLMLLSILREKKYLIYVFLILVLLVGFFYLSNFFSSSELVIESSPSDRERLDGELVLLSAINSKDENSCNSVGEYKNFCLKKININLAVSSGNPSLCKEIPEVLDSLLGCEQEVMFSLLSKSTSSVIECSKFSQPSVVKDCNFLSIAKVAISNVSLEKCSLLTDPSLLKACRESVLIEQFKKTKNINCNNFDGIRKLGCEILLESTKSSEKEKSFVCDSILDDEFRNLCLSR